MKLTKDHIKRFQKKVFSFYHTHQRSLPWRQTTDPYKILLSEIMLQQTQVTRVITYYHQWISQWSTIKAFAAAPCADVLKAWMGLGYNTRAVRLHNAAKKIVTKYHGDVLDAMRHYQDIPGVGRYTAHAVQIFASNADIVTVDTNIRRIFITEFHLPETVSEKDLWTLAEQCLPKGRSRDWHNALMDYGALHLTAQNTGIKPKTRQTRFQGSDRQIRAQILRHLLQQPESFTDLQSMFTLDRSRLKTILDKMINDALLVKKHTRYSVKND